MLQIGCHRSDSIRLDRSYRCDLAIGAGLSTHADAPTGRRVDGERGEAMGPVHPHAGAKAERREKRRGAPARAAGPRRRAPRRDGPTFPSEHPGCRRTCNMASPRARGARFFRGFFPAAACHPLRDIIVTSKGSALHRSSSLIEPRAERRRGHEGPRSRSTLDDDTPRFPRGSPYVQSEKQSGRGKACQRPNCDCHQLKFGPPFAQ